MTDLFGFSLVGKPLPLLLFRLLGLLAHSYFLLFILSVSHGVLFSAVSWLASLIDLAAFLCCSFGLWGLLLGKCHFQGGTCIREKCINKIKRVCYDTLMNLAFNLKGTHIFERS